VHGGVCAAVCVCVSECVFLFLASCGVSPAESKMVREAGNTGKRDVEEKHLKETHTFICVCV